MKRISPYYDPYTIFFVIKINVYNFDLFFQGTEKAGFWDMSAHLFIRLSLMNIHLLTASFLLIYVKYADFIIILDL